MWNGARLARGHLQALWDGILVMPRGQVPQLEDLKLPGTPEPLSLGCCWVCAQWSW